MSEDPPSLLSLPSNLFYSEEAVVKSLTCDDLDLGDIDYAPLAPVGEEASMPPFPDLEESSSAPLHAPVISPPTPTCMPWLLTGLALMALNAYLPQMSSVSSLWYPLQVAIPVLHWAASWWFVLPRWETNLVSLAPLSHTKPLNSLKNLAHTVDKRFVLAYPTEPLALVAPAQEETLVNLGYLLAWYCPLLKTIRNAQSNGATSMTRKLNEPELVELAFSQSGGSAEISLKPSSAPGLDHQNFSSSQLDASQVGHVIIP
ncbi:hypothetical protein DSO57_1005518 [Entomophthora muscae]|uniref:Uncharacterized protein n=1 Tax=Entomophthora muscae TaxID=34485 RepID=A0ACC2SX50_9FUNG|nr:hypothetical protein DSO57_1005518 [Entomophthora muscae]